MNSRIATFLAAVAIPACAPAPSLGVPSCPNPVLIGPVDRVGGHRAAQARTIATVSGEISEDVTAKTDKVGKATVTTTSAWRSVENARISEDVLSKTEGRRDRDVHVDRIDSGAFVYFFGGYGWVSRWTSLKGRVVEVGHAR